MRALAAARILLILLGFGQAAYASSGITYHGRLLNPDGTPVISSTVQFRMQIRTPGVEDCLLYEEIQTHDLSTKSGMFALSLGDGSGIRQDSYSWTLFDSLSNRKDFSFVGGDCFTGTSFSPNASDNRKFRVFFNDGSFTGWEALPVQTINFIPMSVETLAVGGFPASSLLRVETAGTLGLTTPLTATQYSEILALVGGTSSQYEKDGELNGSALPTISSGESVRWTGSAWQSFTPLTSETDPNVEAFAKSSLPTCATGEVLKSDGTSLSCVTDAGGWSAVDATTTVKGIVNVPTAGGLEVSSGAIGLPDVVTGGTYTKVTVDAKGRVTTGANITGSDITSGTIGGSTSISTTGSISAASMSVRQIDLYDSDNSHHISLLTPATTDLTTNYDLVFPVTLGSANQVLGMNNAGTALENKSITAGTGVTITHSAGGIAIAATGSGGTVTSVSGTSPISVATGTSTPVISLDDAGTAGTYGSSTEVPVFTTDAKGRVTSVTETTISGVSPVGSALATGQAWIGDGSGDAQARFIGINDLKTSLAGNANQIPTTCTASQTMTYSAVTDVFSCTNISITASQVSDLSTELSDYVEVAGDTMTGTLNLPSNGLAVGTSELVVSGGKVGIGTTNPSSPLHVYSSTNGFIQSKFENANAGASAVVAVSAATDAGMMNFGMRSTAAGAYGYLSTDGASGMSLQATNASGPIIFQTGGFSEKMRVTSSGNVGIGTTTPSEKLEVAGNIKMTGTGNGIMFPDGTTQTTAASGGGDFMKDGSIAMIGQFKAFDGDANTPGITFAGEAGYDLGLYRIDSNRMGLITNGTGKWSLGQEIHSVNAGGALIRSQAGTSGAPSYSFMGDINTGIFSPTADTLAFSTNATEQMRITSSGSVGIGTTTPNASALLDVFSTTKGVLIPRMTAVQRDAIATPAEGLQVYNTDSSALNYYDGDSWEAIGGSGESVTGVTGTSPIVVDNTDPSAPVISISDTGTAGTYGSSTEVPVFTTDAKGRVTAVTNTTITGTSPVGSALADGSIWIGDSLGDAQAVAISGDISILNTGVATVDSIQGIAVSTTDPTTAQVLKYDGTDYKPSFIGLSDIRSTINSANNLLPVTCDASETLVHSAVTDTFVCTTITYTETDPKMQTLTTAEVDQLENIGANTISSAQWGYLSGLSAAPVTSSTAFIQNGNSFTGAATLGTNDAYALNFETSGTTKMTILSGGNVGIGTTNPMAQLTVHKATGTPSISISSNGTGTGDSLTFSYITKGDGATGLNNAATNGWHWYARSDAYTGTANQENDLGLNYYGGTTSKNVMYFDSVTGNVGIGTTNPTGLLHVDGGTLKVSASGYPVLRVDGYGAPSTAHFVGSSARGTASAPTYPLSGDGIVTFQGRDGVDWQNLGAIALNAEENFTATEKGTNIRFITVPLGTTTPAEQMRITADGKVGIGSTIPQAKLDVVGGMRVTSLNGKAVLNDYSGDTTTSFNISGTTNSDSRLLSLHASTSGTQGDAAGGDILAVYGHNGTSYIPALNVENTGNVGIGSGSPRADLDVGGTVVSRAAFGNGSGTIDFSKANLQYTNGNCGAFALHNLIDGGVYTFAVKGTTAATCTFTAYSDAGTTALTMHLPPDHGPTDNGSHTVYSFMVIGSDVYATWITGY